ncbi:MerR family transcriptional regulator [Domibacillus sp. A3M-37]|uniref:MerR family transcriptional regulator n=1 Tax=Domibacillus sp. A3M-37 TaxID=2962037 RepID=UPI0035C1400F
MTQTKGQGAGNLSENLSENLEDMRLTVKEAANYVNESPGVVRNWLRELKSYIPTMQGDNGYHYFDQRALERLMLIRQLNRDQHYSIKQIEYYFATGEIPVKPEAGIGRYRRIFPRIHMPAWSMQHNAKLNLLFMRHILPSFHCINEMDLTIETNGAGPYALQ